MQDISIFICLVKEIIDYAMCEIKKICAGQRSKWDIKQLNKVVLPEMKELLQYAQEGTVFFKYGKNQCLLESTYLMTDSLEKLEDTNLGNKIGELQKLYDLLAENED